MAIYLIILLERAVELIAPGSWGAWAALVLLAFLCLLVSAFVSGSEIAFFGLTPQEIDELRDSDDPASQRAVAMLDDSERLLATILITNNLVNITMVVLLTFAIGQVVRFHSTVVNFILQTVLLTFLLLLFGEIFPKLVARGRTLRWVRMATPGISFLCSLFKPLAKVMTLSTMVVNRIVTKKNDVLTTDELEKALEISDVSEGKDKEMLEGILSFGEKEVSEVMVSRVDVTDIEYHAQWDEAMKVILESGYSRIPVYDTSQDTIRGILYAKDLLPYIGKRDNNFRWQTLIREPYFVPESRNLDDMLEDFRKRKIHIAIVVDEYGGTRGIVTLEDIIEEIVGEIDDEYDDRKSLYRKLAPDTYVFDAKVPLSDFCRDIDVPIDELEPVGEAETLAGLLLEIKGDFPERKESLRRGPCRFLVLNIERHRITRVRVMIDRTSDEKTEQQ
ncbi:MAG: gliding motility-associated protein GldE [Muribaculaceae bacterium]|nr:gliding motility-associated protein GldE [Muribaculaceae bacterium]